MAKICYFRADSLTALQRSLPNGEGPEPILIDIPHRRTSVSRPGGGSLVGLQPAPSGLHEKGGKGKEGGRGRGMGSPPRSPELMKQTSEEELLDTAVNIGLVRERGGGVCWGGGVLMSRIAVVV